jgi:hypothetical protein
MDDRWGKSIAYQANRDYQVDVCIYLRSTFRLEAPTDYLSLMGLNEWKLQGGGRFIEMRPPRLAIKCNLAIYPSLLQIPVQKRRKRKEESRKNKSKRRDNLAVLTCLPKCICHPGSRRTLPSTLWRNYLHGAGSPCPSGTSCHSRPLETGIWLKQKTDRRSNYFIRLLVWWKWKSMALADYWNGKKGSIFSIVQEYWWTGSEV